MFINYTIVRNTINTKRLNTINTKRLNAINTNNILY